MVENKHQNSGMRSLIPAWLRMVINQMNVINVFILNHGIIYMLLLASM